MQNRSVSLSQSESALDARARRAARSAGYVARKSRWRAGSIDNFGGFVILDPRTGFPLAGFKFDMSAEEVIAWARDDDPSAPAPLPGV